MKTISIDLYSFDELPTDIQKKVLNGIILPTAEGYNSVLQDKGWQDAKIEYFVAPLREKQAEPWAAFSATRIDLDLLLEAYVLPDLEALKLQDWSKVQFSLKVAHNPGGRSSDRMLAFCVSEDEDFSAITLEPTAITYTVGTIERTIHALAMAESEMVCMLLLNEYMYNVEQAKAKLYLANGREFDMSTHSISRGTKGI
jgi:hypothetical protein